VLAGESFTLSQAYYLGSVNGNPDHRAIITEGDFIDLREDLDATARGKKNSANFDTAQPRRDDAKTNKQADPDLVYAALSVLPNSSDIEWPEWNSMGMACWHATSGDERAFAAFDMWSHKSAKYNEATTRERWQRYFTSPPTEIGAGTIFQKADQAQPGWRALVGLPIEKVNEILRLAKLSMAQYDTERKETAKRLGLRLQTLDDIVGRLCSRMTMNVDDDARQGSRIEFAAFEPWPDAVDGQTLVADMVKAVRSHMILSEHQALAVALWIIHTHAVEVADHTPRLQIKSPTMRCGKSTLLNVIKPMVPRALNTENITTAALFRLIEMYQPMLLIDEADSFLKRDDGRDNEEMRGIMNAGHGRQSGSVIRTVGEDFEPRAFNVFGPIAFAWLVKRGMHVAQTLEDRSITIELRRRLPEEKIERLRSTRTGHLRDLGRRVARWFVDHKLSLVNADPPLPEALNDRAQDNWRPLVAIADAISTDLSQAARDAAIKIAAENIGGGEEDASIMALADVAAIFELRRIEQLASQDAVAALIALEDRPWGEWRRGRPLTKAGLARLLKPFGIKPKELRFGPNETRRGYEAAPIREAKSRFVDTEVTVTEGDLNDEF
jgi:hypothetical protein